MFASRVNTTKIIKLKYVLLISLKDTGKDDPSRVTETLYCRCLQTLSSQNGHILVVNTAE